MSNSLTRKNPHSLVHRIITILGINFLSIILLVILNEFLVVDFTNAIASQTAKFLGSNTNGIVELPYIAESGVNWKQECSSSKFVVYTAGINNGKVIINPQYMQLDSYRIAQNSPLIVQTSGKFNRLPLPTEVVFSLDNGNDKVVSEPTYENEYGYSFITTFHELEPSSMLSVEVEGSAESLQTLLGTAVYALEETASPTAAEEWFSFGVITNVYGYNNIVTSVVKFDELPYQTDLHLSLVILDDRKGNRRSYRVDAVAGGVIATFVSNDSDPNQELIEVISLNLTDVPTGASQLSLQLDTSEGNESIILSGINVNYHCHTLVPPPTITPTPTVTPTITPTPTATPDPHIYLPIIMKPQPIGVNVTQKSPTAYVGFHHEYIVSVTSNVTLTNVTLINELSNHATFDKHALNGTGCSYVELTANVSCLIASLGPDAPFAVTIPITPIVPTSDGFMKSIAFATHGNAGGSHTLITDFVCEAPRNNQKPWQNNNNFYPGPLQFDFNYCGKMTDTDEINDGKKRTPDYNDYYTFTVTTPGTIRIVITGTEEFNFNSIEDDNKKIHLAFYNVKGERLAYTKQKNCREILYKVDDNAFPKNFHLRVYRYHPSDMEYILRVEFKPNEFDLSKDSACK